MRLICLPSIYLSTPVVCGGRFSPNLHLLYFEAALHDVDAWKQQLQPLAPCPQPLPPGPLESPCSLWMAENSLPLFYRTAVLLEINCSGNGQPFAFCPLSCCARFKFKNSTAEQRVSPTITGPGPSFFIEILWHSKM